MNSHPHTDPLAHLRPAMLDAHFAGVEFGFVPRTRHYFAPPESADRFVAIVCDDDGRSEGPSAFNETCLVQLLRRSSVAFVHAWALDPLIYHGAVFEAALLRRGVVVIETRLEHEHEWVSLVERNAGVRLVIVTPINGRA